MVITTSYTEPKKAHVTYLIGQFLRGAKFYSEILFIGSGPGHPFTIKHAEVSQVSSKLFQNRLLTDFVA